MTRRSLFRMRMGGLLRKEMLQILRDPSSIALAVVLPLVMLFLFGYGVSLDAEHVPLAVVLEDHSGPARDLAARFEGSRYFDVRHAASPSEARQWLDQRAVEGIVHLQSDFAARVHRQQAAPVQVIVNGVDANRARLVQAYARGVLQQWGAVRRARGETTAVPAVTVVHRVWFNEAAASREFLVPGLIALIMTLIGTLLTALVVAREWERGTMEAILVTPLRRIDLLLGKLLPYFFLGMAGMGLSVVLALTLFQVPLRGSIGVLFALSALFMLAALGLGLMISAAIRIQFVAAQISIVTGFLPAVFLSGLLFDLESTPPAIQLVSHVVPARYFVTIIHTLFMAGNVWSVLLPNALALLAMAVLFIALAYRHIAKRLEAP